MSNAAIFWAVLALVLIGLETLAPGILFLWLGFAAAGVFLLLVIGIPVPLLAQILVFVILSFVSVGVYWRYFRKAGESTDQPLLNRKQDQLLGRILVLESAIVNGHGRVQIGDAFWQVQGPDAPRGARVIVIAADDGILKIDLAD
ncbi:MAG: NfeD family protein [Arenimonas sp.]|jgi:membrane protein implicated in regulation of membrane protease activity|uniref:NfeD family protein n=1 Tax=Arenimonas sp. TaxID=1872635 RepID=UPI003B998228